MDDKLLAELCKESYNRVDVKVDGNEGILEKIGDTYYFAVRGTTFDFEDIIRDIRAVPWLDKDIGWCHSGFLKGGRDLYKELKTTVPFLSNNEKLILTGHSLGAAIANIIAAKLLTLDNYKVEKIVTFGCPRTGFSKLTKILEPIPQYRYRNGIDCVPKHPYAIWGYRHTSPEITLHTEEKHKFKNHRINEHIEQL